MSLETLIIIIAVIVGGLFFCLILSLLIDFLVFFIGG